MLDIMRQSANKWFIKVLLALIMMSFLLWGILDIIMNAQRSHPVLKVGAERITLENFAQIVDARLQALQQDGVRDFSNTNVPDFVLKQLIHEKLIDAEMNELHLAVSDSLLRDTVQSIPAFQTDGRFDPEKFRQILAANRMSEIQLVRDMRHKLKIQSYVGSVFSGMNLPKVYRDRIIQAIDTPYVFATIMLSPDAVKKVPEASIEDLKLFFDQNRESYTKPELRTVHVMYVDVKKLLADVEIDDAEIRSIYQERESNWRTPERREVVRIVCPTETMAKRVIEQINAGRTPRDLTKEFSKVTSQEDSYTQADAPQAIAQILFTLPLNGCTSPIEIPSGYAVYVITKIEPEIVKTFESVKEEIADELRATRQSDMIKQWSDQIEDDLAAGKTISDVARERKLKIETVQINSSGMNTQGKPELQGIDVNMRERVIKESFELQANQTSPLIEGKNHSSVVVSVAEIHPSRMPDFAEVVADVRANWVQEEKLKIVRNKAEQIINKNPNITELSKRASKEGLSLVLNPPISQSGLHLALAPNADEKKKPVLPAFMKQLDGRALERLFTLGVNQSVAVDMADPKKGVCIVALDRQMPVESKKDDAFHSAIQASFERDMANLLVLSLAQKHVVEIDHEAVKHLSERVMK